MDWSGREGLDRGLLHWWQSAVLVCIAGHTEDSEASSCHADAYCSNKTSTGKHVCPGIINNEIWDEHCLVWRQGVCRIEFIFMIQCCCFSKCSAHFNLESITFRFKNGALITNMILSYDLWMPITNCGRAWLVLTSTLKEQVLSWRCNLQSTKSRGSWVCFYEIPAPLKDTVAATKQQTGNLRKKLTVNYCQSSQLLTLRPPEILALGVFPTRDRVTGMITGVCRLTPQCHMLT